MVCWVVSDEQPGIGADGFQEIFTATMMASLEWGCYDYARGVLDNWLTYFIKDKGFVLYRGLEMAQHGRMLTNIAQCMRPGLPPLTRPIAFRSPVELARHGASSSAYS